MFECIFHSFLGKGLDYSVGLLYAPFDTRFQEGPKGNRLLSILFSYAFEGAFWPEF